MGIFDKFNESVDLAGLQEDVQKASENKTEFKDIPDGTYEVKVTKMEMKVTKTDKPMLSVQMQILAGEYKGQYIFPNFVLMAGEYTGFMIHKCSEFLKGLDSGVKVEFKDYNQYSDMVMDIMEVIDGKLEYAVEVTTDKKGYKNYTIKQVFASDKPF